MGAKSAGIALPLSPLTRFVDPSSNPRSDRITRGLAECPARRFAPRGYAAIRVLEEYPSHGHGFRIVKGRPGLIVGQILSKSLLICAKRRSHQLPSQSGRPPGPRGTDERNQEIPIGRLAHLATSVRTTVRQALRRLPEAV